MSDMVNMEWDDIEPAQELLLRAFKNYPMHNWIFDTEKNPEPILRALNRACIKYCIRWGKAFKMPNLEVILLVKKPTDKDSFWHNFRAGMLKILFLANKTSVKRMVWINQRIIEERKKIMEGHKHWYPWIMATSPEKMHQGFGGIAIRHMIKIGETDRLPIYLQTSSASAIDFYLAFGFKVCSSFPVDNNFSITTMVYQNGSEILDQA